MTGSPFELEHGFYHSSDPSRISKLLDRWFLYQKVLNLQGSIYELGVFQGVGVIQWATFNKITGSNSDILGFDTFSKFPNCSEKDDLAYVGNFLKNAGNQSIRRDALMKILVEKDIADNVLLIEGNFCDTIQRKEMIKPKLINLDFDLYFPSKVAIETLWLRLQVGGILIIDDYDESLAVRELIKEYFSEIIPFRTPFRKLAYLVK